MLSNNRIEELNTLCNDFRIQLVKILHSIQTGHPGGSLSSCEIITTLYQEYLNVDPENPKKLDRDRFILAKGHAAPMYYLNLAEKGFFPKEDLVNLRQINSHLQGHPCMNHTPGVDLSTGPLGLGISAGVGVALSMKLNKQPFHTYVLLGDGEIQEGIVWEAAMSAAKYKLDNLIAILDNNGVQLDGMTEDIMPLGSIKSKFESFGWHVIDTNGHDIAEISKAIESAKSYEGKPILINAKTVKGKGISYMENKNIWHGRPISTENLEIALKELEVK